MTLHILEANTKAHRAKLPATAFVFSERRSWPIHDEAHALHAISYMKGKRGEEGDYPEVIKALRKKWGDNKKIMRELKEYTG